MKAELYVIRNNYSGTYVHRTLFRIRAFRSKYHALRFMRNNGLNEKYYEVLEKLVKSWYNKITTYYV